ncbi:Fic family protein [Flavobacterium sp.]|uniref:Fic family protein n=1 Tax=Flavobacterium sp. TaxID=239 RepID=UPI00262AB63E|nr:Fic family protein [Flavobacterium sp.]
MERTTEALRRKKTLITANYAENILYIHRKLKIVAKYIYQNKDWTNFIWQDNVINSLFGEVRNLQGRIFGQMNSLGFSIKEETNLSTLTLDVIKSSEIEGEQLNYDQVRSSIARRLGLDVAGLVSSSRAIEGVVEMMLDATQNYTQPLTDDRLFGWHSALFPSGRSGMYKIEVGTYRTGEMVVVSGAMGKEKIHYEAPAPHLIDTEMFKFLKWFNEENDLDPVLKAAIAHFWFIIIHPFDDGNGRIARAITDLMLARSDKSSDRFYSMSNQILVERKQYYAVLQRVQHSSGDITEWLVWFLSCLKNALVETETVFQKIRSKNEFWNTLENTSINERQRIILNKLLDNFQGNLTSSKWAKITKTSQDTALRDIADLVAKGILIKADSGGRSTHYALNTNP